MVRAAAAVGVDTQDLLLGRQVERVGRGVPLEARQHVVALPPIPVRLGLAGGQRVRSAARRRLEPGRVVQVDPPVGREVRVQGHARQTLLAGQVDVELVRDRRDTGRRIGQPQGALTCRVQYPPARQHREIHRLAGISSERHHLVIGPVKGRLLRVCPGRGDRAQPSCDVRDAASRLRKPVGGSGCDGGSAFSLGGSSNVFPQEG